MLSITCHGLRKFPPLIHIPLFPFMNFQNTRSIWPCYRAVSIKVMLAWHPTVLLSLYRFSTHLGWIPKSLIDHELSVVCYHPTSLSLSVDIKDSPCTKRRSLGGGFSGLGGSWVSGRSLGLLVSCNGVPGPIIRSSANLNTVLIPLWVCCPSQCARANILPSFLSISCFLNQSLSMTYAIICLDLYASQWVIKKFLVPKESSWLISCSDSNIWTSWLLRVS